MELSIYFKNCLMEYKFFQKNIQLGDNIYRKKY